MSGANAEARLVSGLINDDSRIHEVAEKVSATCFKSVEVQQVFEAIMKLHYNGDKVFPENIAWKLGQTQDTPMEEARALVSEIQDITLGQPFNMKWVDEMLGKAAETEQISKSAIFTTLDTVEPVPVEWLWRGRIPLGKVTILDGAPGVSKSTLTLDLAARVTRGDLMPDGSKGVSGGAVLLSAEDDAADTIQPRLHAAGANLSRVALLQSIRDAEEGIRPVVLPGDVDQLEEIITTTDAKIVIIDPLMAYLDSECKTGVDHHIRRALMPVKEVAERTRCAVLLVRHLNKNSRELDAINRGGGSIGIIGAARSGMLVARHPEDDERRVLAVTKANLAPAYMCNSLEYKVTTAANGVGCIDWLGVSELSANELMAQPKQEDRGARAEAEEWLREMLADGPVLTNDLKAAAESEDISFSTLKRAKDSAGAKAEKRFDAKWQWVLPVRKAEGDQGA